MTTSPITIYRLRIALADVMPPIWRVLDVPADFSLDWLHSVIQWAMGWEHEKPYRFHRSQVAWVEGPVSHEQWPGTELDATQYTLQKVYGQRGRYLRYVYDMGDGWWHHVWLEDAFHAAVETYYPRLVDGERACPPEGFGGSVDYIAYLHGGLEDDDPRIDEMKSFEPEAFDSTPRRFPNARIYASNDEPGEPQRPMNLSPVVADMLGGLADRARRFLDQVDPGRRADLRRAIEDLVLVDDALPPKTADTLQWAHLRLSDFDDFLVDCVEEHEQLRNNSSTAPFHAVHLLAFWKVDRAIDVFDTVVRRLPPEEEQLVRTLFDGLSWSGKRGLDRLLEMLDDLPSPRRLVALEYLCRDGVVDDRLFAHLEPILEGDGPQAARLAILLSGYEDERATELLSRALDRQLHRLEGLPVDGDGDKRERQIDFTLFLTEILASAGGALSRDQWETLEAIDDFYWPSPRLRQRLRRDVLTSGGNSRG